MGKRSFSVGEAVKWGWAKFKEHPWTWIGALILMFIILGTEPYAVNWAQTREFRWDALWQSTLVEEGEKLSWLTILICCVYFLAHAAMNLGLLNMGLRATDGLTLNIGHLFSRFHYVFHYLIASILYGLVVLAGLLLLIFPGFIWGAKFALYPYFIIDQGASPFHALTMSSTATQGAKWDVFAFMLISTFILFAGVSALIVGLLVATPLVNIAWASIYRKLTVKASEEPAPVEVQTSISGY